MNENHSQEHDLNETIDKAVQYQQPSGNGLIDALAQTTPQADSAFQQKLEDDLIAHLQAEKTEEEVFIMAKRKRMNNSRWPLTLAAAALAIILIGGFLFLMPRSNPNDVLSADMENSFAITATALVEQATQRVENQEVQTAAALVAEATRRANSEIVVPDAVGCTSNQANIIAPVNGAIVHNRFFIYGSAMGEDFGEANIELAGKSTNERFIILGKLREPKQGGELAVFNPNVNDLENGLYQLRLSTLNTEGEIIASCTIHIFYSNELPGADTGENDVVLAKQTIPAGTSITLDMLFMVSSEDPIYPYLPDGMFNDMRFLEGRIALVDIPTNAIVTESMLAGVNSFESLEFTAGRHIGIVVGHQGVGGDFGARCEDGLTELEVNQEIAVALKADLEQQGYLVNVFDDIEANLQGYRGDIIIALHTSNCSSELPSGYSFGWDNEDESSRNCVLSEYAAATGLELTSASIHVGDRGLSQRVFASPSILVLEMGRLAHDRTLLTEGQERVVQGISNSVNCILNVTEPINQSTVPMVMAIEDIALGEIITAGKVTVAYFPQDEAWAMAEENAGTWYYSEIDDVVGKQSQTRIHPFEPITNDDIAKKPTDCSASTPCISLEVEGNAIQLPPEHSAVTFSTASVETQLVAGDKVDVWASIFYTRIGDDGRYYENSGDIEGLEYSSFTSPTLVQQVVMENVTFIKVDEWDERHMVMLAVHDDNLPLGDAVFGNSELSLSMIVVPHVEGAEGLYEPKVIPIPPDIPLTDVIVPFVVPLQDIALGEIITEDMVGIVYLPKATLNGMAERNEDNSYSWYLLELGKVIGKQAQSHLRAFEPITNVMVGEPIACEQEMLDCLIVPEGKVALVISIMDRTATQMTLGDSIDVIASFPFTDLSNDGTYYSREPMGSLFSRFSSPSIVTERIIRDGTLLAVEANDNPDDPITVTLAVSPGRDAVLYKADELDLPLFIVPHVEDSEYLSHGQPLMLSLDTGLLDSSIPVVIAVQDIAYGKIITADMVTITYMPENDAAGFSAKTAGLWYYSEINSVIGMQAQAHIRAFEPIMVRTFGEQTLCEPNAADCENYYTNTITISIKDAAVKQMIPGDLVDIIITETFTTADENGEYLSSLMADGKILHFENPSIVSHRIIAGAKLVSVQDNGAEPSIVTVAVNANVMVAEAFAETLDLNLPLFIVPHVEGSEGLSVPQVITLPQLGD